ncbi:polysaccharide deacetylase family protein [Prosthecobacter sp.]|uniref:polysaccharide deacetylase family protein n=1 Tax=Prosthecobacter sp. TaxID=1965333 RepID=UPI00248A3108|nr:polysaccharide deacetylase family protein [Prosthecobacter sp.]MDI1312327.1 polysaccharide deacetylase family protein [Prosthecobacter sp.]
MRFVLPFIFVVLALGTLPSCKRIEAKLQRLAEQSGVTPKPPSPTPEEPALTPEEQAIEKKLQETALLAAAAPVPEIPAGPAFELNKSSVVSILGYHDFKDRGGSPMLIAEPKFRAQMQAIKDSKIPVISFSEMMAWKRGEKNIPEEAIVITMDDGWEGVHTYAYPVLREFGFPFTIYLYKNYIGGAGRSMSWEQIKEMMQHGCEVGSHSVSHASLKTPPKNLKTDADKQQWVLRELKDSREFLEQNLHIKCLSFAYPYGSFDDAIMETGLQIGYESLVTVNGQKVSWDTPNGKLGRYIVHGDNDINFKLATSFRGRGDVGSNKFLVADAKNDQGEQLIQFKPKPDAVITDRRPLIEADLKKIGTIMPESIKLRIAGLGTVPVDYDPATMVVRFQFPYKLRREDCALSLSFQRDATQPPEVVSWRFKIDLESAYMPPP